MIPNNWYAGCIEQITQRMRDRRSHTRPHAGLLGPPFRQDKEENNNAQDEGDVINPAISQIPRETSVFRHFPNVILLDFNLNGEEHIVVELDYYYRCSDGNLIIPTGVKETDCDYEDDRFFCKCKIEAKYNLSEKKLISCYVIEENQKSECDISNEEKGRRQHSRAIITHQTEAFTRKGTNESRAYIYRLNLDVICSDNKEGKNLVIRFENDCPERLSSNIFRDSEGNYAYSYYYGFIYELEGLIKLSGNTIVRNQISNSYFDRLNNVTAEIINDSEIRFKDSKQITENIQKLRLGQSPIEFLNKFNSKQYNNNERKHKFSSILSQVLQENNPDGLGFKKFRIFQQFAIERIMNSLEESDKGNCVPSVITAQTAAGKTEAFMIPLIQYCIEQTSSNKKGAKTIIFYPTKSLANDQANRICKMLFFLNKKLDKKISLGILHGDISNTEVDSDYIIFTCPYDDCDERLIYNIHKDTLTCPKHKDVIIDNIVLTRNGIYSEPPDIVIMTPDMVHYLLINKPETHALFGRKNKFCTECGTTYTNLNKRVCDYCAEQHKTGNLIVSEINSAPRFLVFDEIHLMKGSLGSHVAFLIDRLKNVISSYQQRNNPEEEYKPVFIGSTATIKNPEKFAKEFFGTDTCFLTPESNENEQIYENTIDNTSIRRIHHFSLPLSWTPLAYTIKVVERFFEWWKRQEWYINDNIKPKILVFVNSIKDANDLISSLQSSVSLRGLNIGGHNTDFDRRTRIQVEKKFNTGNLHVLIATRTLEVGVDFNTIHTLLIYGSPYSYNDYLQRIGRAGRKNHSLVFNIFKPYIPIDNYYFSNCDQLVLQEYREQNIEYIPIKRLNARIIEKMHICSILDSIMSQVGIHSLIESSMSNLANFLNEENNESIAQMEDFCKDSLGKFFNKETFEATLYNLRSAILGTRYFKEYFDKISALYYITNLRYADKEIELDMPSFIDSGDRSYYEHGQAFTRSRSLGYCVTKLFQQAAVSFRGYTLQVSTVETEDTLPCIEQSLYNQLHRRVNRNTRLRRHAFLHPNREEIKIHVPGKVTINWGDFKYVVCRRCGHIQEADRHGISCNNCNIRMVNAPIVIKVPISASPNLEAEFVTIGSPFMLSKRNCQRHGLVFHLLTLNPEDPVGSLNWVCPHCKPDMIGGNCRTCSRMLERRNQE